MNSQLAEKLCYIIEEFRITTFNKVKIGELQKSEFLMLYHIKLLEKERGYVTTSDLSERMNISKPAISQMMNLLEDKKYIQRIINKDDRRTVLVSFTDYGNTELKEAFGKIINFFGSILDMMGEKDSEIFIELLRKYVSKAKEYAGLNKQ